MEPEFDAEGLFDDDYLHFYRELIDTGSDAEATLIWELLGLEPGTEVLDLACGHGRLAGPLAARGCRVTGLDSSAPFLDRARTDAAARGIEVDYVLGDMRELPWTDRFDAVFNWFTAFGYFSDEGNRRVLAEVHRSLKPGGRFAMELNNVVNLLPRYLPAVVREVGEDMSIDQHRLDPITFRSHVERTIVRGGERRTIRYSVRFFTVPELRDWLRQAGFRDIEALGEDGSRLTREHERLIVTATRG
ncbi:Ubiquinone/menaquinone biosynthesis C-methylase UbiE [Saccharopolyspora kobensis]|uniref:Ubiquinone/menaquinone biosynthesis C-methylase UbiE n=1 Tax=Saccharopolyspora kobensis TaxID=146035 RepID=A0A1H6DN18_9PSEU|nr:class I SAM-dependent methyltransferase [Saccharopolyspora kobensis]SEG86561.1 Ubiquinone/menaquinone biosynthesis C-methylase UbiE [Saccharopolyspora kobensis]SFE99422.1 Ubiquinone/menaquinone biosynthesis C-methylase UbiE [Saccharopolyspora kobensis]